MTICKDDYLQSISAQLDGKSYADLVMLWKNFFLGSPCGVIFQVLRHNRLTLKLMIILLI